jgi:hypothetical protein
MAPEERTRGNGACWAGGGTVVRTVVVGADAPIGRKTFTTSWYCPE